MFLFVAVGSDVQESLVVFAFGTTAFICRPFEDLFGADVIRAFILAPLTAYAGSLFTSAAAVQLTIFTAFLRIFAGVFIDDRITASRTM